MAPATDIGLGLGDGLAQILASAFEAAMKAVWEASLAILRGAFLLADKFSRFTVDTKEGPIGILWPMMLWISATLALGLFFWQLIAVNLRGGRGFLRLVGGPVQYGIALAVTVGMVAALLIGADGLTEGILNYGLNADNFTDALKVTSLGDAVMEGVAAVVLGICSLVGVIPTALGYILEMIFRQAAVEVLTGAIPVVAAGLVADVSAAWFWTTLRWIVTCIAMKPVIALVLVIGVALTGGAQNLSGLLAGVGVFLISLAAPWALFRLLAFIDPNSEAGSAFRQRLASLGVESYGKNNPALLLANGLEAMAQANASRFDTASGDQADLAGEHDAGFLPEEIGFTAAPDFGYDANESTSSTPRGRASDGLHDDQASPSGQEDQPSAHDTSADSESGDAPSQSHPDQPSESPSSAAQTEPDDSSGSNHAGDSESAPRSAGGPEDPPDDGGGSAAHDPAVAQ